MKKLLKRLHLFMNINLILFELKWRKKNKHNQTHIQKKFNIHKVKVGKGTYGDLCVYNFGNKDEKLEIGNFCSIGPEVKFLLSGEHNYKNFSTYPSNMLNSICKGKISIKDDVWIGFGAIILSGVTIGQGAVIGAGSVVAKDVPPYAIFVDNDVRKYRFSQNVIKKLLNIDFSKFDEYDIRELNKEIVTEENIDKIIAKIERKFYDRD